MLSASGGAARDARDASIRMENFPVAWLQATDLQSKVVSLLTKFGKLHGEPEITYEGEQVVVFASFITNQEALAAVQKLHNMDLRPRQQQTKGPAAQKDRFCVRFQTREPQAKRQRAEARRSRQHEARTVVIRGFPASWGTDQLKAIFALYGGVCAASFSAEGGTRVAQVELSDTGMRDRAVEHLHNTKVGEPGLIDECVLTCEALEAPPARHQIFLDELESRLDLLPVGPEACEVFLQRLPVQDCDQDQIQNWLEGFGPTEDLILSGSCGYVRYANHEAAAACVQAQASADGDVLARWVVNASVATEIFPPEVLEKERCACACHGLRLIFQPCCLFEVEASGAQLAELRRRLAARWALATQDKPPGNLSATQPQSHPQHVPSSHTTQHRARREGPSKQEAEKLWSNGMKHIDAALSYYDAGAFHASCNQYRRGLRSLFEAITSLDSLERREQLHEALTQAEKASERRPQYAEDRVKEGKGLVRDADSNAKKGDLEVAHRLYKLGLKQLMESLGELKEQDAESLRSFLNEQFDLAERVRAQLVNSRAMAARA